uniref:hypothetical protein n=1 Tax=Flavobacterium sp. TaxID=239 RepID=UPI00404AE43F
MANRFTYILLSLATWIFGQNQKEIKGLILVQENPVPDVVIINLSQETVTTSDENGRFVLTIQEDDLLTFSAVQLNYWRQSVDAKTFESGEMIVQLTEKTTELEEVAVTEYTKINAYDLGIIPKKIETLTPAERRLKLAGDFKYYHLLSLLGGSLPIEPIINKISGRTKRLKKELNHEQKEILLAQLDLKFEDAFYVEKLKIPEEYIKGFKQYCIAFPIEEHIINPDKTKLELELTMLASDFLSYLYEEN